MTEFADHVYTQTAENRFVLTGDRFDARIHWAPGKLTVAVDGHPLVVFALVSTTAPQALRTVATFSLYAVEVLYERGITEGYAPESTAADCELAWDAVKTAWGHYNGSLPWV